MTLVIDKTEKQLVSLSIGTYLDDPNDAVNVTVGFSSSQQDQTTFPRRLSTGSANG